MGAIKKSEAMLSNSRIGFPESEVKNKMLATMTIRLVLVVDNKSDVPKSKK